MQKGKRPLVSIIVTTKNEEAVIGRLLRSIKNQSYPLIEIIVVDNNSTDNTKKIAKKYKAKLYNFGPERSAQRNFGIKKAKGSFVLILDADMKLEKTVVGDCISKITGDSYSAALVIPEYSIARFFWERVKAFERSFYNLAGDPYTDAARFFRKKVIKSIGGYDETITGPEDWDLPERVIELGYKTSRIKSVIYHYERIPSLYSLIKKKYYYALRSNRYLKQQKISIVSPKTIYFLRPVFYKQWTRLILHPILTLAMFYMFTLEMAAGGIGYLIGKYHDKN